MKRGVWQIAATLSGKLLFVFGTPAPFLADSFFTRGISSKALDTLKSSQYQSTVKSDPHFGRYPEFLETAKKNLKMLSDAGVRYGFGTDTGPPGRFPGYFEHWEMELMVAAGLTPQQVLTAATRSAAEFLGAKDLGTLAPSKWADLIVLERNPLDDIRNTKSIRTVYVAGNQVYPK
jgi:imidazolonepropionase-like amidohydrolase